MRVRWLTRDVAFAAALFVATSIYLGFSWPLAMVGQDEGEILYGAKRVFDGEVMYRDFFDQVGPIASHVIALVYMLFGVSMEAARASMAVLHGAIVALMYVTARQLGVRPVLAALVGWTHVALFYPALPFTSPHWFATLFTLLVFWLVLRQPVRRNLPALVAGALTGLVGLTQQPKGAATAVAVALVLVRDVWVERGAHGVAARLLVTRLAAYGLGVLAVVVPTLGLFVGLAGFDRVYDALIRTPLVGYRALPGHRDGRWPILTYHWPLFVEQVTGLSSMLLLNLMPLIIPISALRLLRHGLEGLRSNATRPLFVAVVFSAMSIVSVFYQPNSHHFAVVAPIWFSLFGELLERVVQRLESAWRGRWVAPAAAAIMVLLLMLEMRRAHAKAWRRAVPGDTAFGRVHFRTQFLADEVTALRTALAEAGTTDVFVYPTYPGLYLLTQSSNPTRFQILIPVYSSPDHFAEVQQTLERERVPFVIRSFWVWGPNEGDPLLPYLREHYEQVRLPRAPGIIPSLTLLRRKSDDRGAARPHP